ncbi:hypothetical protein [Methylocapsa acidiphila]|uniref:hypothetical protein n=1 Tax=Methylocapsa acidiphila TaxID=133552 RepID=UPI001FDA5CEE|nr:hypothetical protein [Methylocapsa acidiphila]
MMRKWDVFFTATKISKGLELDLFENPESNDEPPRLSAFDVLSFEVVSRRTRFEGRVLEVQDSGEAVIEAQGARWRISPATDADKVHPVARYGRASIFMVRDLVA